MAIPANMAVFEKDVLRKYTPCRDKSLEQIVEALAVVHVELVLIHPFRDGNGRMARLLSILMGWQAKLPTLNFGSITGKRKNEYFAAVRAGMARNYKPMEEIFGSIIRRTLKDVRKR
jgi:cell filamentation protein